MPTRADTVHLLRRTEIVARASRIAELQPLTLEQAVDDILDVPADPGSVEFVSNQDWERHVELNHFWFNKMAHPVPNGRPVNERLAMFWHGHFVSSADKVGKATLMREQIDLFRRDGLLGNVRDLAITMATQVAMIRYLDNNANRKASPNQNFGRELMELFVLGVGNYTERDVEACAAAWTGHGDYWEDGAYVWHGDWHDGSRKRFLGRWINDGGDPRDHGNETIRVMLGNGVVPDGATNAHNRGRPTREVAAEFLSRKLWTFFAGTNVPDQVVAALRDVLIANDFAVRPWLRALLLRPEFYADDVKAGLVRSPAEYMVALLAATGLPSEDATPIWQLESMGQRLLYPPNVSGWRHNAAFVSAGAFGARASVARHVAWRAMREYWEDNGDRSINLAGGSIHREEVEATGRAWNTGFDNKTAERHALADRIAELAGIELTTSRSAIRKFARNSEWWELGDLVPLIFLTPEMHVA